MENVSSVDLVLGCKAHVENALQGPAFMQITSEF